MKLIEALDIIEIHVFVDETSFRCKICRSEDWDFGAELVGKLVVRAIEHLKNEHQIIVEFPDYLEG